MFLSLPGKADQEVWHWDRKPESRIKIARNSTVTLKHELRRPNTEWQPSYHIFLIEGMYGSEPLREEQEPRPITVFEYTRYRDPATAPTVSPRDYDRYHRNLISYHSVLKTKFHREIDGGERTDKGTGRRDQFRFPTWLGIGDGGNATPDAILRANSYRRACIYSLGQPTKPAPQTPKFEFTVGNDYTEVDVMLIEKSAATGDIDNRYHLRFVVE
ncbi:MAG: hypothetical protein ABMA13_14300 [Chthoniobacteraceae bacterium]